MITSWVVYTLLVSVLVAAAARCLEEVFRTTRRPVRFVWLAALVSVLVLGVLAPHRAIPTAPSEGAVVATERAVDGDAGLDGAAAGTLTADVAGHDASGALGAADRALAAVGGAMGAVGGVVSGALNWPLRAVASQATERADRLLGLAWLTLTATLLVLGLATLRRYRAIRRRWPVQEMAGTRVRVSPGAGPAVLGLLRPEIVVPRWLLQTSPEEQRLVVLHEREHLRAHDPLTLVAGWGAVALMPWNPVAWWMLARLRTAVELDCDARVLRAGVAPGSYGSMLIDIAGRGSGLSLGVTALAGSRSTLETRILAMKTHTGQIAAARAAALGVLGAAALLAACETRMLTGVEIDALDVAAVEAHVEELELIPLSASDNVLFVVDGVVVTAEEARRLSADSIVGVEILRGEGATIRIRTAGNLRADAQARGEVQRRIAYTRGPLGVPEAGTGEQARGGTIVRRGDGSEATGLRVDSLAMKGSRIHVVRATNIRAAEGNLVVFARDDAAGNQTAVRDFDGLLVVDGVIVAPSAMRALDRDQIESIEVIKGAAATRLYDNPRAANGVIKITTKGGGDR
jgi:hypothetical protein